MKSLAATFRYVLITAIRDRFLVAIFLALLAILGGSLLLGSSAVAEGRAMGLSIAAESMRGVMVLGLITFISFHVRRMEETREIEAILTRPIARPMFVLGYFSAYAGISVLLCLPTALLLMVGFQASGIGLMEWEASLLLESFIVVAVSLFCALSLGSATVSVLAGLGLYGLARMAAFFRSIAEANTGISDDPGVNHMARWMVEAVAAAVPRLDLFGQSRWLIYGPGGGWEFKMLLIQTSIFIPLLLLATIRDVQIKRY